MSKILGMSSAYKAARVFKSVGTNMGISSNLVIEMVERIAELEEINRSYASLEGDLIYITKQDLAIRDLEQQAKGIESAIDAALDLGLIENDVLVCKSIREQAKGGAE